MSRRDSSNRGTVITLRYPHRYGQIVASDSTSTILAEPTDLASTTKLVNPLASIAEGGVRLTGLTIEASLDVTVPIKLSVPALGDVVAPIDVSVTLTAQCPAGTVASKTAQGNIVCQACAEEKYEKAGLCLSCPKQVYCEEGSTVSDWKVAAGNWRTDDESEDVRECRFGITSCPGHGKNQSSANSGATGLNPYCSANHVGHLCSACAADFFLDWTGDGECYQCATGKSHAPTIGLLGGVFVFVFACLACVYKKRRKKARSTIASSTPMNSLFSKAEQVYSLAEFKAFTLFLTAQVVSEFATVSNGTGHEVYPEPARTFVRALGVTNLDIFGFVPLGCIVRRTNFCHKALFKAVAPPIVIALLWCYPLLMTLRGIPSLANNSAKRLSLLLLEVTLPNIATTLVQLLGSFFPSLIVTMLSCNLSQDDTAPPYPLLPSASDLPHYCRCL